MTPVTGRTRLLFVACSLVRMPLCAPVAAAAASAAIGRITPTPQILTAPGLDGNGYGHRTVPAVDLRGWAIAGSAPVGALPLARLLNATAARLVDGVHSLPQRRAIAMGVPSEDAALAALAAVHGASLHPAASISKEGYALLVQADIVLVLGSSAAGVFYGAQSLLQLLAGVRAVTFSFLCPLFEKYGTLIERCTALIEKVPSFRAPLRPCAVSTTGRTSPCAAPS
eukprot:SAG31_NODE_482_length_15056_cov_5.057364_14_plen_226_part_00